jgi:hypothetical protein
MPSTVAKKLGINLDSRREGELFRWFLACLPLGKPIQQEIAEPLVSIKRVSTRSPKEPVIQATGCELILRWEGLRRRRPSGRHGKH